MIKIGEDETCDTKQSDSKTKEIGDENPSSDDIETEKTIDETETLVLNDIEVGIAIILEIIVVIWFWNNCGMLEIK